MHGIGGSHVAALEGDRQFVVAHSLVVERLVVTGGQVQLRVAFSEQGFHVFPLFPLALLDEHVVVRSSHGDGARGLPADLVVDAVRLAGEE